MLHRRSSLGGGVTAGQRRGVVITRTSTLTPPISTVGPTVCNPEDLKLKPGELSTINRLGRDLPQDVFRCFGCVEPACQVRAPSDAYSLHAAY